MLLAGITPSRALVYRARQPFARAWHSYLQLPSAPAVRKPFKAGIQFSAMTFSASSLDVQRPPSRSKAEHRCQDRGTEEGRSSDDEAFQRHHGHGNRREAAEMKHLGRRSSRSRSRSPQQLDDDDHRRCRELESNDRHVQRIASHPADSLADLGIIGSNLRRNGDLSDVRANGHSIAKRDLTNLDRAAPAASAGGCLNEKTTRNPACAKSWDTSTRSCNEYDGNIKDSIINHYSRNGKDPGSDQRREDRDDDDGDGAAAHPLDSPNLRASRRRRAAASPQRSHSRSPGERKERRTPSPDRDRAASHSRSPPRRQRSTSAKSTKLDSRSGSARRSSESGKRRRSRSPDPSTEAAGGAGRSRHEERERSRKDRSRREDYRITDVCIGGDSGSGGNPERGAVAAAGMVSDRRLEDSSSRGERCDRDRPDPRRSRSRSRSRNRSQERDRERRRDGAGSEKQQREKGAAAVAAAATALEQPYGEPPSASTTAVAASGAQRGGPSSGTRLLVSFADELDEEGGPSGTGSGGRTGSLAASTAKRFMREEAAARLAIPARTITTIASSSLPMPMLTGSVGPPPSLSSPLGLHTSFGQPNHHHQTPPHLVSSAPIQPRGAVGSMMVGSSSHRPAAAPPAALNGFGAGFHMVTSAGAASTTVDAAVNTTAGDAMAGVSAAPRSRGGSPEATRGRALGRILFGTASARCARPYMEDRHCIVQCLRPLSSSGQPLLDGVQRSLAAIYDGHNGTRAADTAASRLHMLLAADAALRTHTGELAPPAAMAAEEAAIGAALRRCFRRLDDEILAEARADGARDGATALLVMRLSDTLYAAHAGDSRAVLSRRGNAVRLTEDHKPHLPAEKARVEAAGGRVDFQRCWRVIVEPREGRLGSGLAVSRSLGDLDFKEPRRFVESEPDVRRVVPQPGDNLVVLGSDGLWDVMSDQEAVNCANAALQARRPAATSLVYRDEDAQLAAQALLEEAQKRGTADNVTVIVMLLQWN